MTETIMSILILGGKIFSEERRRYFSNWQLEVETAVKNAENATYPNYNDSRLALAEQNRDLFLEAYKSEFETSITALLARLT